MTSEPRIEYGKVPYPRAQHVVNSEMVALSTAPHMPTYPSLELSVYGPGLPGASILKILAPGLPIWLGTGSYFWETGRHPKIYEQHVNV